MLKSIFVVCIFSQTVMAGNDASSPSFIDLPSKGPSTTGPVVSGQPRATILTAKGLFAKGIEGPGVSRENELYVVNYKSQGTIGHVFQDGHVEEAFRLPSGSIGNAIRFDAQDTMYIADYKKHNIFRMKSGEKTPSVFYHNDDFHQPNDLTISFAGDLYASDPDWKKKTGQLWHIRIDGQGKAVGHILKVSRQLGTVNGIELSPDDKTLYVTESQQREIWSYRIDGEELKDAKRIAKFNDFSLDGLRATIDGDLFVARIEKGTVLKLTSQGAQESETKLNARNPTNLAFGGPKGDVIFVSQADGGFIETFGNDRPGREYCLSHGGRISSSSVGSSKRSCDLPPAP